MWSVLLDFCYPPVCVACQYHLTPDGGLLCLACDAQILPTNFHLSAENPVMERFWGRLPLHSATVYSAFSKGGLLRKLIHRLKYQGQGDIGIALGWRCGQLLRQSPLFETVDEVLPVPLHPKKQHERGYNQAERFAKGIAQALDCPLNTRSLMRPLYTQSQTKKTRQDRFSNVQTAFALDPQHLPQGKHLLLVDDVITTGATLEACGQLLQQHPNCRLSLAAIALAN
jgi:ComF family protein